MILLEESDFVGDTWLDTSRKEGKLTSSLVGFVSSAPFELSSISYVSDSVQIRLAARFYSRRLSLFNSLPPALGQLKGQIFEQLSNDELVSKQGSTLQGVQLLQLGTGKKDTPPVITWSFQCKEKILVNNFNSLSDEQLSNKDILWYSLDKTEPFVDALAYASCSVGGRESQLVGLQWTVQKDHSNVRQGSFNLLNKLDATSEKPFHVLYGVPDGEVYDVWKNRTTSNRGEGGWQRFKSICLSKDRVSDDVEAKRMRQYVVTMPFDPVKVLNNMT